MKFYVLGLCFAMVQISIIKASDLKSDHTKKSSDAAEYSGFDQRGNFFRGNNKTGFYFNYGTGETCFGKFQQRKCYYSRN